MVVYWNSNEEHHDLMRFKHDLTCFEWDIIAGMSWKHLWEYMMGRYGILPPKIEIQLIDMMI